MSPSGDPIVARAREYLRDYFGGTDVSAFSDDDIRRGMESAYLGGWCAFAEVTRRDIAAATKVTPQMTPVQLWSKARRLVMGDDRTFRLKPYEVVHSVTITDESIVAVVERHKLRLHARRDVIAQSGLVRYTWTRDAESWTGWSLEVTEVWTNDGQQVVTAGRVATPEYVESQIEQVETCYRPGTHKTPMQGWVARAELSWAQAHADDMPEVPSKED